MAGSVNKVILVGNLGRDPEVHSGRDGSKIVGLSVATSDTWKDKTTGERRHPTPERADIVEARFRAFHAVYVGAAGDPARVDRAARLLRENMAARRRVAPPPGTPDMGGLVHA